ncbi:MAG TPA: lipoate--protein ligase [Chloroflexota bacterium]|nr:lipoate--protein ligase [Chloroflexota bacterium]HUM68867.1 lipoate--protein ligase [Chloroflexota bacterium]
MLFVDNQNITDPRVNLAIEEYVLRHVATEDPILLFYINEPSVIIGRNQNTLEEIDTDFVRTHNIHVVRRLSGGGAVYHDLGNLNFSFMSNGRDHLHNFARFTEPVARALRVLGVDAELRGKSDIYAAGKKISGNAQYAAAHRMFSHGTLLFDSHLETLLKALNPRQLEITSNAVQSIRAFVVNIRELLPVDMDIHQLKEALLQEIFGGVGVSTYDLTTADWEKIHELSATRYRTWEWNVGRSPRFNVRKQDRFEGVGKIDMRIEVHKGLIEQITIYGDYAGLQPVAELEKRLIGVRYDPDALAELLEPVDMTAYFGNLEKADFLRLLY